MSKLVLKNINKIYPNGFHAVHDFNLEINDGEFIVLVGSSGCGKSTTLRMIAGLEEITSGEMILDGEIVNKLAPVDREVAMVFQNYALYYNMSVYDNMGISLKVRHEQKDRIHSAVKEAAERFDLVDYLNRFPANLSGGQRQRVALGRTVVREPKLFLMDEPLSNLDAKLREKTRSEIVKLQKNLKTTTIYVTHDQIEAMTMADRIIVMSNGYIMQVGTPKELYSEPDNLFVAGFIGTPPMNFLEGVIQGDQFVSNNYTLQIDKKDQEMLKPYDGKKVTLGVRPEFIDASDAMVLQFPGACLDLPIDSKEFLGKHYYVDLKLNDKIITAKINSRVNVDVDVLKVVFRMDKVLYFDPETQLRIKGDALNGKK